MKTTIYTSKLLFLALLGITTAISSCARDENPIPIIPPSDGTEMTLNGGEGGSSAENTVFVDLSTDKQEAIKRISWNLGFYSGSQFRVILNNTSGATALKVNKTDLNAVSESDIDLADLTISLGTPGAFGNIDDLTGDLTKTLIPEISATDNNNQVFVINPIGGSHGATITADDLFKVRILRSGNDYTLQYAKLNATTFQSLTIKKDNAYNFNYVSLENGPITIEPKKAEWDFEWTWSLYVGGVGENSFPYGYSDLVFINYHGGVTAAEIVFKDGEGNNNEKPSYEDFNESHLTGITFSNSKSTISSNWRKTAGTPLGALSDRYYLIKDSSGNIYKLKFTSMGAGNPPTDGGKRGYPELEYKLVKQG
jgi:hypothetical protein